MSARADVLTYTLLSSSTITPYNGSTQIGPAEHLSGSFQWSSPPAVDGNYFVFNAASLNFSSPSFTLTLNSTPTNNVATSMLSNSEATFFLEIVDLDGLSIPIGEISSLNPGKYVGPSTAPTRVSYVNYTITPPDGGLSVAHISFTADLVPEPSSLTLVALGAIGLLFARRRFARKLHSHFAGFFMRCRHPDCMV